MAAVFFMTLVVMLVMAGAISHELAFMKPWRLLIWHEYWPWLSGYGAAVFVNIFAVLWKLDVASPRRGPGRKVAYLDREFLAGHLEVRMEEHHGEIS